MPDPTLDPYAVLKLPRGSSPDEIRKQYRRLARIYHPDRNPGDAAWCEEQLKELNAAFALLSDPAQKAACDASPRTGNAPARNDRPRADRARTSTEPETPAAGFHDPASTRSSGRRGRRSILPLLGASLAGAAALGTLTSVMPFQAPLPPPPAAKPHRAVAATVHAGAPKSEAGDHHAESHSPHRKTPLTAHALRLRTVAAADGGHRHAIAASRERGERPGERTHLSAAQQKDATALRIAEAAEARRKREIAGRLKRISPQAMIRQMQNAARGL